jgi:hypothetical protein
VAVGGSFAGSKATTTVVATGLVGAPAGHREVLTGQTMLICIPEVLSIHDVAEFRRIMDAEEWDDGRSTAGAQSAQVKQN